MSKRIPGLVSVIMPCFNAEGTIERAILSVLNQSYEKVELIIVDDASTDRSAAIISRFLGDSRVVPVINPSNKGVSESRNIGLRSCNGEYVAFLDSDDYWFPFKIEAQIREMQRVGCSCAHGAYWVERGQGNRYLVKARSVLSKSDLEYYNPIGNLTGMYRVPSSGPVMQRQLGHEDYVMWWEILSFTDSIGLVEPCAVYSDSGKSISSNKAKAFSWYWNIQRNIFGFGLIRSVSNTFKYFIFQFKKRSAKDYE